MRVAFCRQDLLRLDNLEHLVQIMPVAMAAYSLLSGGSPDGEIPAVAIFESPVYPKPPICTFLGVFCGHFDIVEFCLGSDGYLQS